MDISKLLEEYGLDFSQIKEISSNMTPISLKKGENFIQFGERSQRLGILIDGFLYSAYYGEDGQEWISRFFYLPDNFIISNHESFFFNKESSETIVALENSQILFILKGDFENLLNNHSKFEHIVRNLAEISYIQALKRIHDLQSLSAEQRVRKFYNEHKDLLLKIQKKHIASYLGIHRNILTRFLNKL